jgi:hypothetical protein
VDGEWVRNSKSGERTMSEPTFVTRALEKSEYQEWDEFVVLSPQGTIFSNSNWLSVTSKALKTDFTIYGCFSENRLVGGCPLFHGKRFGLLSFASNTCGLMPYSGIVLEEIPGNNVRKFERQQNNILTSIATFFQQPRFTQIKVQNPPKLVDIRSFTQRGWESGVRYTYFLDLANLNYSRDIRRNLNAALKNEVFVTISRDIESYYPLYQQTFERQGLKVPVSKGYLEDLYEYIVINDLGDLWVAKTQDEKWIAAEIFLHDNNYIHRWTAVTDPDLRKSGGYHLLLDTAFRYYLDRGMNTANLMAANTPQLAEFITGFNPYLVPYYSLKKSPNIIRNQ